MALVKRVLVQQEGLHCAECKRPIQMGEYAVKDRSGKYDITPAVRVPHEVTSPGCQGTVIMEVVKPKKVVRHLERPTLYYCESCSSRHKRPGRSFTRGKHA